jgi:hypothetical protein
MKTLTRFAIAAAMVGAIGSVAALADDSQFRNWQDLQRQAAPRSQESTTVAVYVGERSFGRTTMGAPAETAMRLLDLHLGRGQVISVAPSME